MSVLRRRLPGVLSRALRPARLAAYDLEYSHLVRAGSFDTFAAGAPRSHASTLDTPLVRDVLDARGNALLVAEPAHDLHVAPGTADAFATVTGKLRGSSSGAVGPRMNNASNDGYALQFAYDGFLRHSAGDSPAVRHEVRAELLDDSFALAQLLARARISFLL